MEFLFAGAATLLGQGVVGAVDNREADHTILYSLETLIHVVLPQSQALHYTAVLNTQTHIYSSLICFIFFFADPSKESTSRPSWPVLLQTSLVGI